MARRSYHEGEALGGHGFNSRAASHLIALSQRLVSAMAMFHQLAAQHYCADGMSVPCELCCSVKASRRARQVLAG